MTDFLEKQAGRGICDPEEVFTAVMQRAVLAPNGAERDMLTKLATTIKEQSPIAFQPAQLIKLAEALDTTDRNMNLIGQYGEVLRRPEDVIFSLTMTKMASDHADLCSLVTGNVYSQSQFTKLSMDDVEACFGSDFVDVVSSGLSIDGEKMAEIAHTLPRPEAELLDNMMKEAGLHPKMQKSASFGRGPTSDDFEALAATYGMPAA